MIIPITPIGRNTVMQNLSFNSEVVVSPNIRRPSPAAYRVISMASWTSPRVSARTLPISMVIRAARSSLRSSSIRAALNSTSARPGGGVSLHVPKAFQAAFTARSTSSSDAICSVASFSRVAGLISSKVSLVDESVHSPLLNNLYSCIIIPQMNIVNYGY